MNATPYRPRITRIPPRAAIITPRQAQCLDGLCDGYTYSQLAADLGITPGSVKMHLKRLYAALGADNAAHAVGLVLTGRVTVTIRNQPGKKRAA